jgi:flagellar hook-associated protein 1 FlgK
MAARSLEAQRLGLDVTGQNIANVNTPGYARRSAILSAIPPDDRFSSGGGVEVVGIHASRDRWLERRLQIERPAQHREAAIADTLSVVEVAIGQPGASIDRRLNAFFDSASRLSADPTSPPARQELILAGESLAGSFRDMAGRLDAARRDTDRQIQATADEVNALAARLASLNAGLERSPSGGTQSLHLRDAQKVALDRLTQLIDAQVLDRPDGGVYVSIGHGRPLVVDSTSYRLDAAPAGPDGHVALMSGGQEMTDDITGGRLGGLLHARDVLIPAYTQQLDELAYRVADEVNRIHMGGYDRSGNPGGAFFTPLVQADGAASALSVDATLAGNPALVAAAGVPVSGDNQGARLLAALRDNRVMNGGQATFNDAWGQLVYRVGSETQTAMQEQQSRADIVKQVETMADAVSGVSLDEEAMMMLRFQRAYEATAQFFKAVNDSIDTLLGLTNR